MLAFIVELNITTSKIALLKGKRVWDMRTTLLIKVAMLKRKHPWKIEREHQQCRRALKARKVSQKLQILNTEANLQV